MTDLLDAATVRLRDLVEVCGSKNAGPFLLTLDVICKDQECFDTVRDSGRLTVETVAAAYSVPPSQVRETTFEPAFAFKFVIPRLVSSGDVGDTDVYGCQQHIPLLNLPIS
ncbi:hypothetical protein CH267_13015 [Rhodococcus sp. 06-621-2]|nr:DUF4387 domain-containing protein [Rhodococcus sp. 06-621-2]OZC55492.1 hypothetical protein CH267_13015 [Rhodococcus sp. 06-621-2]